MKRLFESLTSAFIITLCCGGIVFVAYQNLKPNAELNYVKCKLKAADNYPDQDITSFNNSDNFDEYLKLCMGAHGFDNDLNQKTEGGVICGNLTGSYNSICFRPKHDYWFSRIRYQ